MALVEELSANKPSTTVGVEGSEIDDHRRVHPLQNPGYIEKRIFRHEQEVITMMEAIEGVFNALFLLTFLGRKCHEEFKEYHGYSGITGNILATVRLVEALVESIKHAEERIPEIVTDEDAIQEN